jgi:drug/metabolite transporter (DMT)-like permease
MMVEIGLLVALGSALATNVGFLMRHRGAVAAPDVDAKHPLRSAAGLFRQKWWTLGYVVAIVAYLLHVGALRLAPLSLVQAVLAGGLVLLGVLAERFFGFKLGKREWLGISLTAIGLAFLAVTGETGDGGTKSADYSLPAMIAFEGALVALGTLLIVSFRGGDEGQRGVLLGAAAGLLFTMTHVAVKALTGQADSGIASVLLSPHLLMAIAGGVVAFFVSARSLQLGHGVSVIAVTSIAGNASSIPAGIVVFGDPLGSDALSVVLRTLAFIMVIVAATLIPAPTRATAQGEEEPDGRRLGREPRAPMGAAAR